MAEVCKIGGFSVLHTEGSELVTVTGQTHGEQLDLAGWQSRFVFYRKLKARDGGKYAGHYASIVEASKRAIEVLS